MIILDTHVWIWWQSESKKLSATAFKYIEEAKEIGVSVISCWELGMLVSKGRLGLSMEVLEWIELALQNQKTNLLPITYQIAVSSTQLHPFHGDPADRLLVATALAYQAPLISKDEKIQQSGFIQVYWE